MDSFPSYDYTSVSSALLGTVLGNGTVVHTTIVNDEMLAKELSKTRKELEKLKTELSLVNMANQFLNKSVEQRDEALRPLARLYTEELIHEPMSKIIFSMGGMSITVKNIIDAYELDRSVHEMNKFPNIQL